MSWRPRIVAEYFCVSVMFCLSTLPVLKVGVGMAPCCFLPLQELSNAIAVNDIIVKSVDRVFIQLYKLFGYLLFVVVRNLGNCRVGILFSFLLENRLPRYENISKRREPP